MPDVDPNPYSPSVHELDATAVATGWRATLAAVSFLVGLASFLFGILAVIIMTLVVVASVMMMQNPAESIGGMLADCVSYLGFGTAWMTAGWCYWHQRYRQGLLANAVGTLIAVALSAILAV